MRHIRALLAAGLPTAVIGAIAPCVHDDGEQVVPDACPGVLRRLHRGHDRLSATIDHLHTTREHLTALIDSTRTPDPAAGD